MNELAWPFLASEALAAKALPERAMRSLYDSVYPGVYAPGGLDLTASQRAEAAWLWSRRNAVVSGCSAAALLGSKWVDAKLNTELIGANRHPPSGITVFSETLLAEEVSAVGGIAVTSPARTAFDIGRRVRSRLRAVQQLDALACATDVKIVDVEAVLSAPPACAASSGCGSCCHWSTAVQNPRRKPGRGWP